MFEESPFGGVLEIFGHILFVYCLDPAIVPRTRFHEQFVCLVVAQDVLMEPPVDLFLSIGGWHVWDDEVEF